MTYDDYVVIVPVDNNKVLIQRQYKPGAKKVCGGFAAGFKKKRESFLTAAKRELWEETGYRADNWKHLGTFYDNVSVTSARFAIYLATSLHASQPSANHDKSESKIENSKITIDGLAAIKMEGACMALAKELLSRLMGEL